MKRALTVLISLLVCFGSFPEEVVTTSDGRKIVLYDDHTWREADSGPSLSRDEILRMYRPKLRPDIQATDSEVFAACELLSQGWTYTMPRPKSEQAAWGNTDGRTTWWLGFWRNTTTNRYSDSTPVRKGSGLYLGDDQKSDNTWRNGGSPPEPDIYMFLLSEGGGPHRR